MLETGERIFGMEHATKKASSVSHLNQPTNFDISQLYNKVKILPSCDLNTYFDLNASILQVKNGTLTPKEINIPVKGGEGTAINQIDKIQKFTVKYEPSGELLDLNDIDINETGTRFCIQNKKLEAFSINVNFEDFISTPEWNGSPMNFIYVHCCTDLQPDQYNGINEKGGGIFYNMLSDIPSSNGWMPLISGTQISSRTIAIPFSYNQKTIRLMIKGCRSWSVEFLTYITGI